MKTLLRTSFLHLRQGAVGGIEPRTDPLVAELFVSLSIDQVTSWTEESTQTLIIMV